MHSFPDEDRWRLKAAHGWMELGSPSEAAQELEQVGSQWHRFPELLELRWKLFAATRQWKTCEQIANTFTTLFPSRLAGWMLSASTLHGCGQTEEACELLMSLLEQFPHEPKIAYQLAVYASS